MASQSEGRELVVDRVEGEMVVLEVDGGGTIDLPGWMLPAKLAEGDLVRVKVSAARDGIRIDLSVDHEETERRRGEVRAKAEKLRKRDPGGDITL